MKRPVFIALLAALCLTVPLRAVIVSFTFTGVTTFNFLDQGALNTRFPTGTPWTAVIAWDTGSTPLFSSGTQAQYRVTDFTFTLGGASDNWTTDAVVNTSSFTTNFQFNGDLIQFTTAWGPAGHTNTTLEEYQPYSINLILLDRTFAAIDSLTPAPTALDRAQWDASTNYTQLKFYLNNDGNRYILGSIQNISATTSAIPEPSTYAMLLGGGMLALVVRRRRAHRS